MFPIIKKVVKLVVNKKAVLRQIQKVPQTKLHQLYFTTYRKALSFDISSTSQEAN